MTKWKTSRYRILNRLRRGPATAKELFKLTNSKAPQIEKKMQVVASNMYALRREGCKFGVQIRRAGETLYTLTHDPLRDVKESYWAAEALKAAQPTDPQEKEYHKEDGAPRIVKEPDRPSVDTDLMHMQAALDVMKKLSHAGRRYVLNRLGTNLRDQE